MQAILLLHDEVIKLPTTDTPLSSKVADDPKYKTFFTDCLGALDGTHIDMHVGLKEQPRYRNRKGHLSTNVLAACNFEMEFTYILVGWEGSAHDGAVFRDALHKKGFITPPGKFWLGDAGYPNTDTILVPYRSTRYHLKEQRLAGKKPETSKELYNLRHASLRNVIERIFGVLKRKYQILRTASEYSIATQNRIILVCCILHNFVRSIEGSNADIWLDSEVDKGGDQDIQPAIVYPKGLISSKKMDKFRDAIAEKMWTQYQGYIAERDVI
jgi:DDE superfamily endonuclease